MHRQQDTPRLFRRAAQAGSMTLLAVCCTVAHAQSGAAPAGVRSEAPRELVVQPEALRLPTLAAPSVRPRQSATAVTDAWLEDMRGGSDAPWSDIKLSGTVGNNVATNVATGANIITDGAFSNASGLPTVIQNSGANVLIQNATIVNVQFK